VKILRKEKPGYLQVALLLMVKSGGT
jgi:hypothetical protein